MPKAAGPESAERIGANPSQKSERIDGRLLGGRYRLLRQIGAGGMGTVYLCEHVTLGRRYAIKVLHADRRRDPELVERFRQEARAACRIDQENVIDVLDFGEDPGGEIYYVMEVLHGRSLSQLIVEDGPLPVGRALALLEQVCRALAAAHSRGVVHRDVKPANVLVERLHDGSERVKVIDFGISHLPGGDRLTRDGQIIGTPEYMAPEQATGDPVSALTDVYATGVLAFELLTGTLPLVGNSAIATLMAHKTLAPPPPGLKRPGLPAEVDRLVLRALAKRPSDRFTSMGEMAAEVMRVRLGMTGESVGAGDAQPPWSRTPEEVVHRTTVSLATDSPAPNRPCVAPRPRERPVVGVLQASAMALLVVVVVGVMLAAMMHAAPKAPVVAAPAEVAASPREEETRPVSAPELITVERSVAPGVRRPANGSAPIAVERKPPSRPAREKAMARPTDRAPERAALDPYSNDADPLKPDPFR